MSYKTTKTHFELFKKEVRYWIKAFSLNSWDFKFKHVENTENMLAWIVYNVPGGWCTFHLNTNWGEEEPTKKEITRAAMHEVGELLIAKLDHLARERFVDQEELGIEGHKVINSLINYIFECQKKF
jgi:hypothetical protein